jgi:uncharacterized protein YodC (DUF2158 family)
MSETFNIGDVVVLKSGGVPMTVEANFRNVNIPCTWFHDGKVTQHTFAPDMLKKYVPPLVEQPA